LRNTKQVKESKLKRWIHIQTIKRQDRLVQKKKLNLEKKTSKEKQNRKEISSKSRTPLLTPKNNYKETEDDSGDCIIIHKL